MGKIKDIIYDVSDILTAICIVSVASLVIWFSIGNIMQYPSFVTAEVQKNQENTNFGLAVPIGDTSTSSSAITGSALDNKQSGSSTVKQYSIYINYGESMTVIAQKFVDVGLFESVDQFKTLVAQKNAAASIKSGNFVIPSNSTPDEVITKITTSSGK